MIMQVYRIAQSKYIRDLSGTGARLYGGRWNPKGYAMLYTSEHRSLATLEVLVHWKSEIVPPELNIITLEIPDAAVDVYDSAAFEKSAVVQFKADQNIAFGKFWLESLASVAIKAPSIVIPEENNVLINPLHPDFSTIKIVSVEKFELDQRLF